MKIDENTWSFIQQHLAFTDEEMDQFRKNPVNEEIVSHVPELLNKTVVAEVVESHGCASRHQVGDRFFFDGFGNLLTGRGPEKICSYALHAFFALSFCRPGTFHGRCGSQSNEIQTGRLPGRRGPLRRVGTRGDGIPPGGKQASPARRVIPSCGRINAFTPALPGHHRWRKGFLPGLKNPRPGVFRVRVGIKPPAGFYS